MDRSVIALVLCFVCLTALRIRAASDAEPSPLLHAHAHAHNDYTHPRPLFDALDCGFCSVEADVNLIDGELLVAHKEEECRPDRSLRSLYLDPLRDRIARNGGWVYRNSPGVSLTLLIDIKTEPETTYAALKRELADYSSLLTRYTSDGQTDRRAITIVLTGNQPPRQLIAAEPIRYAACDGGLDDLSDLNHPPPISLVPQLSAEWKKSFTWNGIGAMPEHERALLRQLSERAHKIRRPLRWWGAPDNPATWKELRAAGIEIINTDDLKGVRRLLLDHARSG